MSKAIKNEMVALEMYLEQHLSDLQNEINEKSKQYRIVHSKLRNLRDLNKAIDEENNRIEF